MILLLTSRHGIEIYLLVVSDSHNQTFLSHNAAFAEALKYF